MSENENRLREALAKIAEVASGAVDGEDYNDEYTDGDTSDQAPQEGVCTPKALPTRLLVAAAETATRLNPVNAPAYGAFAAMAPARR